MALTAGARLGPYEVVSPIGAGGMGEVYKARDTRLNRTVAIKILPPHRQEDPERRQRFLREAEAIAALEHPHICVLHDIGHEGGVDFLVMEYLEGETLDARLKARAPSLSEALRIAIEIASALDAAHRHGIVHRDLKPANVILTKSGAKLLDFGLAKLRPAPIAAAGVTMATQAAPLTVEGRFLGTLQYMAPEQLEGKDADARSDVFAFGAVLYEMLAGRHPFVGSSPASLIAAILELEPPSIATLRPMLPTLDDLVRRCLAKNPDDRWQSVSDLAFALRTVRPDSPVGDRTWTAGQRPAERRHMRWLAGSALVGAAISAAAAAILWPRTAPTSPLHSAMRFLLPETSARLADPQRSFALSRDGNRVVFVCASQEGSRLCLRELNSLQSIPLPGTDNAAAPFFSPDGQRVGFFADSSLKTVALSGGPAASLATATNVRGGVWMSDDTIIYSNQSNTGLWQVPAAGGSPRLVAEPDSEKGERSYRWPAVVEGSDVVLFTVATKDLLTFDDAPLVARSLRDGRQKEVLPGGSFATYVDGQLFFVRAGTLFAVPFDATQLQVSGTPKPVLDGVVTYPRSNGAAQYFLSPAGTLLYLAGGPTMTRNIAVSWVDRTGVATRLPLEHVDIEGLAISPDGRRVALDINDATESIWLMDIDRPALTRFTVEWNTAGPFWADDQHVAFTSSRRGVGALYWQRLDRQTAEPVFPPVPSTAGVVGASWSSDNRFVVLDSLSPDTKWDLYVVDTAGDSVPRPLVQTRFDERHPALSRDGRWLAYVSNESGRDEVYVQPFPGPSPKVRVSSDGGTAPHWARSAGELFYRSGNAIVGVKLGPSLSIASSQLLFRQQAMPTGFGARGDMRTWDVAPDGRFLMLEDVSPPAVPTPITVVLNWLREKNASQ